MTISATIKALSLSALIASSAALPAMAQSRQDVIIAVGEQGPNSLDTQTPTSNDYTRLVALQVYDRLVKHGVKTLEDGTQVYDKTEVLPELATSWEISEDGTELTFQLREDATFHDGSPVEAKDVKWSFDRAVEAGGFPLIQMGAGSMTEPDQFEAVDTHTFKIHVPDGNKLALPDLTTPIPIVINSDLALEHATEDDPWATEWLANNTAGGGAYDVVRWTPGNEIVFQRFEDWKNGDLPAMKTVVYRQIASAGTRRALLESGDADVSVGLPPKDFAELADSESVKVIGVPKQSAIVNLEMNVNMPPFDNPMVREAMAYAIPYDAIMSDAFYGRAAPMYGAEPGSDYDVAWPVPSPYHTDLDKAKELLTEAGYPDGFESTIYLDLSRATTREPMALLIQQNLAKIGVDVTIEKVPGSNWFSKMLEKSMPMAVTSFHAWLDWPEYHFYWTYYGANNSVFNVAAQQDEELDEMIQKARFETDSAAYDEEITGIIDHVMTTLPKIPVAQDFMDVAMQNDIEGYVYWFHTFLDFRTISRAD
ncbi:peptide/nickel transport system substrate-binding protein (plasmid) [Salipiger profundus]|jgi:peptide/nickel transport system substrate-binding protein|uniref:Peptide/nickel transport system substrate-binding protein n=1 Tax=Salipiger profundus TaxID=1229727 RepID=A0A1U7DCT5_9RHOB|nr:MULTISPECIES: ABC transporter substrate-binding protein [Salipiger]APX25922.1 peptide/nickel transport system substrate-binding protein [Salipiger profundus]SFC82828.1 peptide/nickel transport system substrate-binding protein [Salipiger profundus]